MNSFKLAFFNVKNNLKLFKFNVASMVFAIAVFFNFLSLLFNPSLDLADTDKLLIKVTIYMTALLLVFFVVFFVFYANGFFLKQRKREIGIYIFMGIENAKIARVYAIEQVLQGMVALGLGLFSGVVFQKAFLMLLSKVAGFRTEVVFHLSFGALLITAAVFIVIFSLAGLMGYISISRSKLIDLLNAEKHEEKMLGPRYGAGFLSIGLILAAFYFSRDIFNENFFINGGLVMLGIVLGTFLFFDSFLSVIVQILTKSKRVLYYGTNIVSISNTAYRIRHNYRTLAFITLIVAATITALGTSLAVQHILDSTVKIAYPYSFSYVGSKPELNEKVQQVIQNSKHPVVWALQTQYLFFDSQKNSLEPKNHPVLKKSDFVRIIGQLNPEGGQAVISAAQALADGFALSVASTNDSGFKDNQLLNMYGLKVRVFKTLTTPLLGARFANNTIVLTDEDYTAFLKNCQALDTPQAERTFNGWLVSDQENSEMLAKTLAELPELKNNLNAYVTYYQAYTMVTGTVKFTGFFLGVVFMLSTASVMYMKLLSDAISDKKQYEILLRLGMSESEIYQAVSRQVGLSYILPLGLGVLYAYMAIGALQDFLNRYFEVSLLVPFGLGVGLSVLVYILFYGLTTKKFVDLVKT
jgi:putative ABC transport system permease protein